MIAKSQDLILEETFEPGIKHALGANFRKWTEAFLELIDNSVSNRISEKPISIEILSSPKFLDIINRGGYGMDIKELQGFLRWGEIKQRRDYDLGAYAQGGKSAMLYLGRAMKVKASPDQKNEIYVIEDKDLHDYKLKKYRVMTLETPYSDGFVEVEISGLKRKINGEELELLVSNIYRPLILNGSVFISHNGKRVKVDDFPLDPEFKPQKFSFPVTAEYKGEKIRSGVAIMHSTGSKKIHGWIGRLTPRSGIKGGIRCYKLGRLICDKEFFGHPDAHYKQTLNFLFGEVHLDHVPATTNKTDFDRDSLQWMEVQRAMYQMLKPHIDDLLGREIREPSEEEKERVKTAKELVAELMKLRKIDLEGPAIPTQEDYGQKPKEKEGDGQIYERLDQRKNKPRTPPPPDAVGRRRRLKEFMEWEIRPMDEDIRSIIEKTGDKKVLVINNLFPGFKAAKGQILYLIETAAMQLSKPEEDEKLTINEYIELFDNLYSFFCRHLDVAKESIQKKKAKSN